ncbi:MAG: hypothetical protein B6D70_01415 [gamma proteobacterium symbiont of Stewartia floridana]|nr:MAG: hypothetical protein B6D76_00230 [gamma proteobacterium symbiont of Stewartia floridana]RLW56757.1 MAG: hypothetical protein B6D75_20010 [gamma proteobacterium symbiont of Stewartia floridana]RLW64535.1 MAG: hypothetical protein B6D73_09805 [gamma proteobacterium symbiont of Stewartia floridana]RLW67606.1 MAG: hypothetical protein B6D70_01415 [gamma proteobacterium symbiont of Stewartia floridana]
MEIQWLGGLSPAVHLNRSGTASATAVEHLYDSTLEIWIWIHLAQKDLLEDFQFLQVSIHLHEVNGWRG